MVQTKTIYIHALTTKTDIHKKFRTLKRIRYFNVQLGHAEIKLSLQQNQKQINK